MSNIKLTPRRAAWEVLNKFDVKQQNAGLLIDEISGKTDNRAALVDIALGTIRNLIFIDKLIVICSGRGIKNIQPKILNCLRIAAYEIIFTQQAQYAIVNEAVELTKKVISKKSAGFTNAILRKIISAIVNKNAGLTKSKSAKILPFDENSGCEFNIDIFADESKQPAEYLSGVFSLPKWFCAELITQYGYSQAKNICFASNRKPSVYARPNILKISPDELVKILKAQDVDCELVVQSKMIKLNKVGNIAQLESFRAGLFTIQDLTASYAAPALNPKAGWCVFDICAAPGTKTAHIAELMGDKGVIVATDKDAVRLKKINENVQRLGIKSVKILSYEKFLTQTDRNLVADAVLLDVPCSNTGVLAKRPEVRYRLDKKQITEIIKTQTELLKFASSLINKGGKICYSTCSILKEENGELVRSFVRENKGFAIERENLTLPSVGKCVGKCAGDFDCDGGYCAIISKK
jgi:16S rRNA (cytosine967-C5)-methyltransferase